jgi:3-oxoacyl-[acyl-carrier-protein] synthase-1
MQPLVVSALSIVSAIGRGKADTLASLRKRQSGLRACDFLDATSGGYIGRVIGLESHHLAAEFARFECRNNQLADLALATDGFADHVARARERHGPARIAVIVGTSTSGVLASEEAYRERDGATGSLPATYDFEHTHDFFSLARFVRAALGLRGPAMVISTACASSANSFMNAHQLIEAGIADAAVVGGADSLCRMTLHGFAALDVISPEPCRPCDAERSGISIGEAAGFALLEREEAAQDGIVALLGYGATSDGYHMSAPHPRGTGAIGAMRAALERAQLPTAAIDYVNLHGTGTKANDAMEDLAMTEVFGTETPCSSTKAWSGHALGAAGIFEAAVAALAIEHGFIPGCLGVNRVDPSFSSLVLTDNVDAPVQRVLSNSFGFGGINCSLVFGRAGMR